MALIFILFQLMTPGRTKSAEIGCEVSYKKSSSICINGEIQAAIEIIFKDYSEKREGQLKEIKNFNFVIIKEGIDLIQVKVFINNPRLIREQRTLYKGGGASYHYNLATGKIVDKVNYK